jgi:hypothetical protein
VKAYLEFDLPHESAEFVVAQKAQSYKRVTEEMDEYFRNRLKFEDLDEVQTQVINDSRETLRSYLLEYVFDI